MKNQTIWREVLEDARWYPSPHNTQPIKIKIINDTEVGIYYDLAYALPEGDPGTRFAWSAVGIFLEALKIAAADKGLQLKTDIILDDLQVATLQGLQKVAHCTARKVQAREPDLPVELLKKRRTNRLDYNGRLLGEQAIAEIKQEAQKFGHTFEVRSDKTAVSWVNKLNARMVFYDLSNNSVRRELAHWSRYTSKQARATKDGLSAECLHVPGLGLRLFMKHHWTLNLPAVGRILKWIYAQNIQHIPTVGWLQGPFFNKDDYVNAGRLLLRVWLIMTKHGVAYQPYGSVITNQKAHEEFCEYFQIDETNKMAWLLMRLGYTDEEPPRSWRRSIDDMIINEPKEQK